jgi:uncharacterized RDD family membrane protein YckC
MENPASPGKRFMAALIDGVLLWAALMVPGIGIVLALVYGFTKDAWPILGGQSIGKKAMGIRAVHQATGKPITGDYVSAIIRQVSLFIPFFNVVDACMVFSADRRRFGDRWAGTVVLEEGQG